MASTIINLVGHRFHRLTVQKLSEKRNKCGQTRWECLCDCGKITVVDGPALKRGHTRSCGCYHIERQKMTKNLRHGHAKSTNRKPSPTYRSWDSMLGRCLNPADQFYHRYGGRGIKVCERWLKFENFLTDMGERQKGYSIDRVDIDGNYCPENCEWVTRGENTRRMSRDRQPWKNRRHGAPRKT